MKQKSEYIKAHLNSNKLTPIQWNGILYAMDDYATAYHKHQQEAEAKLKGDGRKTTLCYESHTSGNCCCNCIHLNELVCHPMNHDVGVGSIKEHFGYVCTVQYPDDSNKGRFMFFESNHGGCELHEINK